MRLRTHLIPVAAVAVFVATASPAAADDPLKVVAAGVNQFALLPATWSLSPTSGAVSSPGSSTLMSGVVAGAGTASGLPAACPVARLYRWIRSKVGNGLVAAACRLKPRIPETGAYGIPLRDELDLERYV